MSLNNIKHILSLRTNANSKIFIILSFFSWYRSILNPSRERFRNLKSWYRNQEKVSCMKKWSKDRLRCKSYKKIRELHSLQGRPFIAKHHRHGSRFHQKSKKKTFFIQKITSTSIQRNNQSAKRPVPIKTNVVLSRIKFISWIQGLGLICRFWQEAWNKLNLG